MKVGWLSMTIVSKVQTLIEYAKIGVGFSQMFANDEPCTVYLPKTIRQSDAMYFPTENKIEELHASSLILFNSSLESRKLYNLKRLFAPELTTADGYITDSSSNKLETFYAPKLVNLGVNAFSFFYGEELDLPSVTTIKLPVFPTDYPYVRTPNLKRLSFPKATTFDKTKSTAFGSSFPEIEEVNIPEIPNVFDRMFVQMPKLKILHLGELNGIVASAFRDNNVIELVTLKKGAYGSIQLFKSPNLTQECLHGLIDNMADRTGLSASDLWVGDYNIAKISPEYMEKARKKNISLR